MALLLEKDERDPQLFSMWTNKRRARPGQGASGGDTPLTFRRHTVGGLLTFDACGSRYGENLAAARELLDRLEVPYDLGINKVRALVKAERQRAEAAGEPFPAGMTSRLIRNAHDDRRPLITLVDDDTADDDSED